MAHAAAHRFTIASRRREVAAGAAWPRQECGCASPWRDGGRQCARNSAIRRGRENRKSASAQTWLCALKRQTSAASAAVRRHQLINRASASSFLRENSSKRIVGINRKRAWRNACGGGIIGAAASAIVGCASAQNETVHAAYPQARAQRAAKITGASAMAYGAAPRLRHQRDIRISSALRIAAAIATHVAHQAHVRRWQTLARDIFSRRSTIFASRGNQHLSRLQRAAAHHRACAHMAAHCIMPLSAAHNLQQRNIGGSENNGK